MPINVVLITTNHLHTFMEAMFEKLQLDCNIKVVDYKNFKNIPEIYKTFENKADGFLISGIVAQHALEEKVKSIKKPIVSFGADSVELYRLLLKQFINNRNLDVNRVIMDFLIPIRENATCTNIINNDDIALIGRDLEQWLENLNIEELYSFEDEAIKKILSLWNEKKFDLIVCCYSSLMPILQEHGVPCVFAYPNMDYLKKSLNTLLSKIKFNNMRENLPVVISINQRMQRNREISDFDMVSLQKCILDFNKDNLTDFLVQKSNDGFDIFTSLRIANHITNNFRTCQLSNYISEHLNCKVHIGYGVGNDISQAKSNASDAKKESMISGGSFVLDEDKNLIGPLSENQLLRVSNEVNPKIEEIAKQSKLSTLTIQKLSSIMSMMKSDELTTQDISTKLGVTVRNANRILNNLEKSGLATILYNKSSNSKGRPTKVYKILFSL